MAIEKSWGARKGAGLAMVSYQTTLINLHDRALRARLRECSPKRFSPTWTRVGTRHLFSITTKRDHRGSRNDLPARIAATCLGRRNRREGKVLLEKGDYRDKKKDQRESWEKGRIQKKP